MTNFIFVLLIGYHFDGVIPVIVGVLNVGRHEAWLYGPPREKPT